MTTIHHSPPPGATPFTIFHDLDDQEPPSPSIAYEDDTSFNSEISLPGADEPIPSIEHEHERENEDEPRPYRSSYTSRPSILSNTQSRRVSGVTTTSFVSELPSEISIASRPIVPANNALDSTFTPRKERPPFRNPSSVRAMQMSSPPPFATFESPRDRLKGTYKLATPSRSGRSETPVSVSGSRREGSHRASQHRESQLHVLQSLQPTPTPQQHLPLVLLHVTILPMQVPYPRDLMVKVMPDWLIENYKLLAEKLGDIVLMRRGMLIPHPNEEYDLLEERILESLELKTPRLLKCGHFVGSEADNDEHDDSDDDIESVTDDGTGRGSRMSGGTITVDEEGDFKYPAGEADDASVCTDCHRTVKKPGKGLGSGTKRWDIKIYAANGLMRAGAWSAAWREMERCDVEISPWIPEEVRKAIEKQAEEEQEAARQKQLYEAEVKRLVEEEASRLRKLEVEAEERRKKEEDELLKKLAIEEIERLRKTEEIEAEKKEMEDALNEKIEQAKEAIRLEFEAQALMESDSIADRFRALEEKLRFAEAKAASEPSFSTKTAKPEHLPRHSRGRSRSASRRPTMEEIPLSTLLRNYFTLLARDQRNIFIVILGALVVFLAIHVNPAQYMPLPPSSLPNTLLDDHLPDQISPTMVTTTATMTATSVATTTVTYVEQYSASIQNLPKASMEASSGPILDAFALSVSKSDVQESLSPSTSASASPKDASEFATSLPESEVRAGPLSVQESPTSNKSTVSRQEAILEAANSLAPSEILPTSSFPRETYSSKTDTASLVLPTSSAKLGAHQSGWSRV